MLCLREYYAVDGVEYHASFTEIRITPDYLAIETDSLAYVKHLENLVIEWKDDM